LPKGLFFISFFKLVTFPFLSFFPCGSTVLVTLSSKIKQDSTVKFQNCMIDAVFF
jgi:hypothetical protein